MSASEPEYDSGIAMLIDGAVSENGAKAVENDLQSRLPDDEHAERVKEALSYLRYAYEDQL